MQSLKNEVLAWMDRHPYSVVTTANPEFTRYSIIIRINESAFFQRWSLMFADALSNLRNALDHLVYTIACHEAAPNRPAKEGRLRFPITDCRANFDAEVAGGRLGDISDPVRTRIEGAQPYNRPHESLPPVLAILRDFNNGDKHKLLHVIYGTPYMGDIGFAAPERLVGTWKQVDFSGEIKDGAEIFAMVSDTPSPGMKFDRTIFDIGLAVKHRKRDPSSPDWMARSDIFALYTEITTEVRRTIYEVSAKVT